MYNIIHLHVCLSVNLSMLWNIHCIGVSVFPGKGEKKVVKRIQKRKKKKEKNLKSNKWSPKWPFSRGLIVDTLRCRVYNYDYGRTRSHVRGMTRSHVHGMTRTRSFVRRVLDVWTSLTMTESCNTANEVVLLFLVFDRPLFFPFFFPSFFPSSFSGRRNSQRSPIIRLHRRRPSDVPPDCRKTVRNSPPM